MKEKNNSAQKRKALVLAVKRKGYLKTKTIEKAFLKIKREEFFSEEMKNLAYEDNAFPSAFGQTISQPSTIAAALEMLSAKKGNRILEVGSGTGYVAALLSSIVGKKGRVFGIELVPELAKESRKKLAEMKIKNVEIKQGNGRKGWKEKSSFDRILISAACEKVPTELFEQLKEAGKLVAPVGSTEAQDLVMFEKKNNEIFERTREGWYVFIALRGEEIEQPNKEEEYKGVT